MRVAIEHPVAEGQRSFTARSYSTRRFHHPFHMHEEIELVHFLRGCGVAFCGSVTTNFADGDLFFLAGNVPHRFQGGPGGGADRAKASVVQFRKDLFGTEFWTLPENSGAALLLRAANNGCVLRGVPGDLVRKVLAVVRAAKRYRFATLLTLVAALADAEGWEQLSVRSLVAVGTVESAERLRRLYGFIARRFSDSVTGEQAAATLGLTRTSFCRYLRQATGMSFTEILNDYRLAQVATRLRESDKPIGAIALDCGFGSISRFNELFRAKFFASPREFRAQWTEKPA